MKTVYVFLATVFLSTSLFASNAFAEKQTPDWCKNLIQQFEGKTHSDIPADLVTTRDEAAERAIQITTDIGIDANVVSTKFLGKLKGPTGEDIYALEVEVTDQDGWTQGNGVWFKFILQRVRDTTLTSLLTYQDVWHMGPPTVTGDLCESI